MKITPFQWILLGAVLGIGGLIGYAFFHNANAFVRCGGPGTELDLCERAQADWSQTDDTQVDYITDESSGGARAGGNGAGGIAFILEFAGT